jgi:hypothetical protein
MYEKYFNSFFFPCTISVLNWWLICVKFFLWPIINWSMVILSGKSGDTRNIFLFFSFLFFFKKKLLLLFIFYYQENWVVVFGRSSFNFPTTIKTKEKLTWSVKHHNLKEIVSYIHPKVLALWWIRIEVYLISTI